jgi:molybdopterin converting factor small subunit
MKMVVSISFCGPQRVVTKTHSIDMPITEKTRVIDALEYVRRRYPDLPLDEQMLLIAVNQEIAKPERRLKANDTIAFVPPISGG